MKDFTHEFMYMQAQIAQAREILKGFGDGTIKPYDVEGTSGIGLKCLDFTVDVLKKVEKEIQSSGSS